MPLFSCLPSTWVSSRHFKVNTAKSELLTCPQRTASLHFPISVQFSSVHFSCSVVSDSLLPHGLQHARPPCPSPTLRVHPNPCPLSRWCHPTISSSVVPFSSCLESFPASRSFQMSQLFASGGQSIGVSASTSVLPMNTQDWSFYLATVQPRLIQGIWRRDGVGDLFKY